MSPCPTVRLCPRCEQYQQRHIVGANVDERSEPMTIKHEKLFSFKSSIMLAWPRQSPHRAWGFPEPALASLSRRIENPQLL